MLCMLEIGNFLFCKACKLNHLILHLISFHFVLYLYKCKHSVDFSYLSFVSCHMHIIQVRLFFSIFPILSKLLDNRYHTVSMKKNYGRITSSLEYKEVLPHLRGTISQSRMMLDSFQPANWKIAAFIIYGSANKTSFG